MNWAEQIVKTLKDWDTSMIVYVPDISIDQVTSLIEADPYFRLVPATREEEAIGIAVGSYATGRNAAVFMQSSGFGNSVNALASLCIPARTPIPMFINLRGGPGEFNIAQVAMGRAVIPIMDQFLDFVLCTFVPPVFGMCRWIKRSFIIFIINYSYECDNTFRI